MTHSEKNPGWLESGFVRQRASERPETEAGGKYSIGTQGQIHKGMVRQLLLTSSSWKGR